MTIKTDERETTSLPQSQTPDDSPVIPDTLPLLPLRDIVIFPNMVVPILVARESSVEALQAA